MAGRLREEAQPPAHTGAAARLRSRAAQRTPPHAARRPAATPARTCFSSSSISRNPRRIAAPMASGVRGSDAHSGAASTFFSTCGEKPGGGEHGKMAGRPPARSSGAASVRNKNGRYSSPLAQAESPRTKGVRKRAHLLRRQRRHQRAAVPVVHGKKGHVGGARQPQRNRVRVLRVAAEGDGGKKAAERSGGALRSARGARCGNAAPQRAARCGLPPKRTSMSTRQPASAKGMAGRAWAVGRRAWRAGDPLPPSSRRSPCMADTPASKLPFVSAEVVFSTLGLSKKAPIA